MLKFLLKWMPKLTHLTLMASLNHQRIENSMVPSDLNKWNNHLSLKIKRVETSMMPENLMTSRTSGTHTRRQDHYMPKYQNQVRPYSKRFQMPGKQLLSPSRITRMLQRSPLRSSRSRIDYAQKIAMQTVKKADAKNVHNNIEKRLVKNENIWTQIWLKFLIGLIHIYNDFISIKTIFI